MSLIWIVVSAMLFILFQNILFKKRVLKRINYTRYFSRGEAFVDEDLEMIEEITNNKILPVPWLKLESRMERGLQFGNQENLDISGEMYHKSVFYLSGFHKIKRSHTLTCKNRGFYNYNSVAVSSGDLFGTWTGFDSYEFNANLKVYPRLLDNSDIPIPSKKWQGDILVKRWIIPDPYLVNGIRDYRDDDNIRNVHWNATARTGELKIKTRDFTASPRLLILLNVQLTENQYGELNSTQKSIIEIGISLAATNTMWALENGLELGFACNGYDAVDEKKDTIYIQPKSGEGQFTTIFDSLARLIISRRRNFQSFIEDSVIKASVTNMDILIISDYWSTTLEQKAQRLRHMGNSVMYSPIQEGK